MTSDETPVVNNGESRYFEAPQYYRRAPGDPGAVFLAGGITGVERWHDRARAVLLSSPIPVVVLNPNRENFPIHDLRAGWEQVSWEQHHLHLPGVVTLFWFPASDPTVTTQPIAMFELGQALGEGRRIIVGAHPDYPRRADVRMLCQLSRQGLHVHDSLDAVLAGTLAEVDTPTDPFPARAEAIAALESQGVKIVHADLYSTIQHGHAPVCCCMMQQCSSKGCNVNAEIIRRYFPSEHAALPPQRVKWVKSGITHTGYIIGFRDVPMVSGPPKRLVLVIQERNAGARSTGAGGTWLLPGGEYDLIGEFDQVTPLPNPGTSLSVDVPPTEKLQQLTSGWPEVSPGVFAIPDGDGARYEAIVRASVQPVKRTRRAK